MNNYRDEILNIFDTAQNSIQIAVSWFTDELLIEKLIEKSSKLKIELLLSSDETNFLRHNQFRELQSCGASVNKVGSNDALDGGFMHSKLIIIDRKNAYGGSYNFTFNAMSNYEIFKKYAMAEVESLLNDFNSWFGKSRNIFDGISDPEKVAKNIIKKFQQNDNRRKSLLHRVFRKHQQFDESRYIESMENKEKKRAINKILLSAIHPVSKNNISHKANTQTIEKKEIIKHEIVKENLRTTANDITSGKKSFTPKGDVQNNAHGLKSKPHRFYGGESPSLLNAKNSSNSYLLAHYQKYFISKHFDVLNSQIINNTLFVNMQIQPKYCPLYKIRIEYKADFYPVVKVLSPKIEGDEAIHMYEDNSLCLFYPKDLKWKNTLKVSEYIIPWTFEWIMYYELWKITGKWEGPEKSH